MNNQKPHKHSRNISGHRNKTSNSISFLKHQFNIFTRNNNNKTINNTNKKISFSQIIKTNLQMYNITNEEIGIIKINDIIDTKNCHLVAIFKDYLISDYIDEFLRRFYKNKESKLRIPKFSDYYKNYLTFFCKPIFSDFFANKIIQSYGEAKAEIYYKKNYGNKNKESKHKHKHKHNKEIAKTIFNTLINESIDYVIKDTKEFISTINTQETMNLRDETILEINGQNKNSNNNSITSLLKCFSVKEKKSKNKIQNLNIKKIKKQMEPNQFQNIQSQNMNMDTSEPKPEERLFCERSFEEVEDGFYDDRGFYTTPNGSFWDDEHNYFNHLGYDKYGGSYDKYGVYQPGNGFNENTGFYKEQEELINNVDMKENDNEKIVKECIDKLKSQQGKDEQIVQRYDNLEEESEDDDDKSNITVDEKDIKEAYDCIMENENHNENMNNNQNNNNISQQFGLNGF